MGCSLHLAKKYCVGSFGGTTGLLPCGPLKAKIPSANSPRSGGKEPDDGTPVSTSRRARRFLFRFLAATLVPALALAGLELGLELGGFGYPTSFFLKTRINGQSVFVENDRFGERFFPNALARTPAPTVLPAEKPPNTIRIFVLGESAALGDPEPAFGFCRYLEVLLRERFEGVRFEVVPAAVTALNSHALVPLAEECVGHDGDIWVIYMGNNEVVGPFGAGTVLGARAPPLWVVRSTLALRATRLGQLLEALRERLGPRSSSPRTWEGMRMFLQAQTRPDDAARKRTIESFRKNLAEILRTAERAQVPVVLSTVACNLKDCAPFASLHSAGLTKEQQRAWEEIYRQGGELEAGGKCQEATGQYARAEAMDGEFAELQFRLGRCYVTLSNQAAARRCLERARDLDALAFRADSQINAVIKEMGREAGGRGKGVEGRNSGGGLAFVDAAAALGREEGPPGQDLFYEHVHLNFEGNYALARVVAEAVAGLLPRWTVARDRGSWPTGEVCNRQLCVTPWDRYRLHENIRQREGQAPFTLQLDHTNRMQALAVELDRLRSQLTLTNSRAARELYRQALAGRPRDFHLQSNFAKLLEDTGDYAGAVAAWQRVEELLPYHFGPCFYLGKALARVGRYEEAERELNKTLRLRPDVVEAMDELAQVLTRQKRAAEAARRLEQALQLQPGNARLHLHLAQALSAQERPEDAMQPLRQAAELRPDDWEARYSLGVELGLRGRNLEAAEQLREAARLRPDYALAHLNWGVALAKQNRLPEAITQFQETLRLVPSNKLAQEFLEKLGAGGKGVK